MAASHPFLVSALELRLLTPVQAEAFRGAADPRGALLDAGVLDPEQCRRVDEALARAAAPPPAAPSPAGRLITKRGEPAPGQDGRDARSGQTVTLVQGPDGRPVADPDPPELWDAIAPLPAEIGVYRVLTEVARGGMGIVVRAYHPGLDKQVAIKLLHPESQGDPGMEERFLREARAAARLRHPGIVPVHDVARDPQGRIYLVMDLVEGESLKMRLERAGPLPPREAARLVEAVARAVAYAHAQGTLHRDLKPHNVLLDEGGQPLLTDFGLAKGVGETESSKALPRASRAAAGAAVGGHELTRTGELVGTPLYMSPEQVDPERGPTTVRSDVWALGVLLYECLTATTPFEAPSSEEVFLRILRDAPDPPGRYEAGLPPALEAIALRCLERSPARRYASAQELADELGGWLRGPPALSKGPPPRSREGSGPLPSLVLGVLVLGLGVVGYREREGWRAVWERAQGAPAPPSSASPPAPAPIELPAVALPTPLPSPGGLSPEPIHTGNVARLAEAGHPDAMLTYGWALASGQLGRVDPVAGQRWMERAAEAGHAEAYALLGSALLHGQHLPQDPVAARRWLERGAAAQVVDCLLQLGQLQRADAEPEAARRSWEEAAGLGSIPAMLLLSDLLGRGPEPLDAPVALRWLERADQAGSAEAALGLGQVFERGALGQPRSLARARACYERAAARGAKEASLRLGQLAPETHDPGDAPGSR